MTVLSCVAPPGSRWIEIQIPTCGTTAQQSALASRPDSLTRKRGRGRDSRDNPPTHTYPPSPDYLESPNTGRSGTVMAGLGAGVVLLLSTVIATPTPQSPLGEAKSATRCGGREAVNETLSELMEDYFQWKLHTYPEWATLEVHFWFNFHQMSNVILASLPHFIADLFLGVPWLQPPCGRLQHGRNLG